MISNALRITSLIACLILAFIANLQLQISDGINPLGSGQNVTMSFGQTQLPKTTIIEQLDQLADQQDLILDKISPDPESYLTGAFVFRFGSKNPVTETSLSTYDPELTRTLLPSSRIGDAALDGQFIVSGPSRGIGALQEWSEANSILFQIDNQLTWGENLWSSIFVSGSYATIVAVIFMFFTASLAWYAGQSKAKALKVLAGKSTRRIVAEDAGQLAKLILLPTILGLAIALSIVWARSGLDYIAPYLSVLAPLVAGLMVLVALVLSLISVFSWPSVKDISSRRSPLLKFRGMSETLKITTLFVAVIMVPLSILGITNSISVTIASAKWVNLKDQFSINNFGTTPGTPEDAKAYADFRSLVQEADANNSVALTYSWAQGTYPDGSRDTFDPYDGVVIANHKYLALMGLSTAPDSEGSYVEAIDGTDVPQEFKDTFFGSFRLQLQDRDSMNSVTGEPFAFFKYVGKEGLPVIAFDLDPVLKFYQNPLIIVVDKPGELLNTNFLAAATTSNSILFSDRSKLTALLDKYQLTPNSIDRAADRGLLNLQYQARTLFFQSLAAIVLLIALTLGVWLAARTYAISRARNHAPKRISGHTWLSILRQRLFAELLIATLLTIIVAIALALISPAITLWWTLLVPIGYGLLSALFHLAAVRSVFRQSIRRRV